jgi:hypothetical protein
LHGELVSDISLEEALLYPLPDIFFGHRASMSLWSCARKQSILGSAWISSSSTSLRRKRGGGSDVPAFAFCKFAATAKINLDSQLIIPPENTREDFHDRPTAVFTIAASRSKHGG